MIQIFWGWGPSTGIFFKLLKWKPQVAKAEPLFKMAQVPAILSNTKNWSSSWLENSGWSIFLHWMLALRNPKLTITRQLRWRSWNKCPAAREKDRERKIIWTTTLIRENQTLWQKAKGVAEWRGVGNRKNFRKLEILITLTVKGCYWMLNCF